MGIDIILQNLHDEFTELDSMSMVNQAEIIDRTWLERVQAIVCAQKSDFSDLISREAETLAIGLRSFQAALLEVRSSNGKRILGQERPESPYVLKALIELTRRMISTLLDLAVCLVDSLAAVANTKLVKS
jgi:hypothetical protein